MAISIEMVRDTKRAKKPQADNQGREPATRSLMIKRASEARDKPTEHQKPTPERQLKACVVQEPHQQMRSHSRSTQNGRHSNMTVVLPRCNRNREGDEDR